MTTCESAWLENLGIADRVGTPDVTLRREGAEGIPHASAMREAFAANVDAFLSIQDVPAVAFAIRDRFDREEIDRLHRALWNQGLASVLLVHLPTEVRVISLWARPLSSGQQSPAARDRRLVETLQLASEGLGARRVVPAVESGHYFTEHPEHFDRNTRVDATLLANLKETRRRLLAQQVPDDIARALILQVVFISYLEDRGIIDAEDFRRGVGGEYHSLLGVLAERDPDALKRLIGYLKRTFNGDVFFAPGVFENGGEPASLVSQSLVPLAEFREGWGDMATRQSRFWGYDFRFIPVELISAIYDRFLNEDDKTRRESGAYFTPRFLADLVVDQVWDSIPPDIRSQEFTVLDPACGSCIFLVRMFKKIVEEHRRRYPGQPLEWTILRSCLGRLHGWDIQESAVRIGVFSLYVALLEQVHPPAIRALKAEGKVLPRLLGKTLRRRDFFEERVPELRFDVIVGNPPWVSRSSERTATAIEWCRRRRLPVPSDEIAWAFVWKAAEHLEADGRVALLLPAMGILLNHSNEAIAARRCWLDGIELLCVVNFADVCFQLFDGADRPTILALYRIPPSPVRDYETQYWVPKAHRLLGSTRLLVIPSADRAVVRMSATRTDPAIWKKRMWATHRDVKLLAWLGELPKLGKTLCTYAQAKRRAPEVCKWVIGEGFKPHHPESKSKKQRTDFCFEESVTRLPYVPASNFLPWVVPSVPLSPWPTDKLHRKGFVDGFLGPHILVPGGVVRSEGFIRAAYVQESVCFQHSIRAIRFPTGEESVAKVLTAILNSSFAAWYYFHTSANLGADRAKVHEIQLLDLPFPRWHESTNTDLAQRAEEGLVRIIDQMLARKEELLTGADALDECISQADSLVFDYYGLTKEERVLVSDAVTWIIPSIQPRKEVVTRLMQNSLSVERRAYCQTLLEALRAWLRPGTHVQGRLVEGSAGVALIELQLGQESLSLRVSEGPEELDEALRRIMQQLPKSMSRNVELHPDLRVFIDDSLYLVKPLSARHWLPSTALNDADGIIADLLSTEARSWRRAEHERGR